MSYNSTVYHAEVSKILSPDLNNLRREENFTLDGTYALVQSAVLSS